MAGTFSSINTSLSALRHHQVAMDVAANNIANVGTQGFTRRRAGAESVGAPAVPAMWSRYDGVGGGVRTGAVERFSDAILDARSRTEHGTLSYLQARTVGLDRLESGIGEPGDTGVAAAMATFRGAWADLADDPGSPAARTLVLDGAAALADAFAAQARNVRSEEATQRVHVLASVEEVNTAASELADTNRAISAAKLAGLDTSDLADQRDRLGLRLADLAGGVATTRVDGGLDVTVAGVSLVTGSFAGRLEVTGGIAPDGDADGAPLSFAITTDAGGGAVTTALLGAPRGEIGGSAELISTTLPGYAAALGTVVSDLADRVNTVHAGGYDPTGAPGRPFFAYDPADPAASLRVALASGDDVAVSTIGGGALDSGVAEVLAASGPEESAYQKLVNGLGTQVASAHRLEATQGLLTNQVDAAREQLGGVNLDEEMISMLTSQRAYEAAARVMTVVDSVLDTLINRTGLVR